MLTTVQTNRELAQRQAHTAQRNRAAGQQEAAARFDLEVQRCMQRAEQLSTQIGRVRGHRCCRRLYPT